MARVSFNQFFRAIAQQESGNNYSAVGPQTRYGRAFGKYQVLESNIGPWTQQYYGRRLTAQQFLNNPQAQEAVARGKLRDYWDRYGARGAASAWYSGDPDLHMSTSAQSGGPSIRGYVDSVMSIARGMPTGGGSLGSTGARVKSSGGGGGGGERGVVTPMSIPEQAEAYGLNLRLINSNKELKRLFDKAVKQSWTPQRFQAALRNTKWWRQQSSDERKYITLRYTDPATWRQERRNAEAAIKALAVQVGARDLSGETLDQAIYYSLARGWSEARLKNWLGAKARPRRGQWLGTAGEIQDDLVDLAYQLGVKYSGHRMGEWIKSINAGRNTLVAVENIMRKDAAAKYTAFAPQIKAGMSVLDLAAPYISAVAEILELPDTDIDLSNNHVLRAMTDKRPANSQYPLWQFEIDLRKDPRWKKTSNARESMMGAARQIARDFGVAY